ncbi:L-homoserine-O-acetyltransferase [Paecilomyces lecythidis]|uniref:L-homoserine-O-acetyltransferase n=1 Tax=Paecilomyces lecythidis TaxID=3004212 RepID=A0ABR3XEJ0_9EURO
MTTLEWPLCTPPGFVKSIVPIGTSVSQGAWGISWSEVQRRCIRSDPLFRDGYYELNQQPTSGLATARMVAMLTYRSAESFEKRFGRNKSRETKDSISPPVATVSNGSLSPSRLPPNSSPAWDNPIVRRFSAHDYLDYQGTKFLRRFDANCYLHLIDKMDMHDIRRGRVLDDSHSVSNGEGTPPDNEAKLFSRVPPHALVIGIDSDVLFRPVQQYDLAACLPDATLAMLKSSDGHDAFLLEFEQLNHLIIDRLKWQFPTMYEGFSQKVAGIDMPNSANGISVGEMD